MSHFNKKLFLLLFFLFAGIGSINQGWAQNDSDPGGGGGLGSGDAPIDGGLTLLLAAGAAYGVKKYRQGKQKED